MATRFYLPASGSPPVTPPALPSGWAAGTTAHYAAAAVVAKSNTALADFNVAETQAAITNIPVAAFVSAPLAAQSISGNLTAVIRCIEGGSGHDKSLQVGVYLIAGDGSSVASTLYAGHAAALNATGGALGQEMASAAQQTRIIPSTAITTQSASAGQRLMILAGYRAQVASGTSNNATLRLGDPTAPAEFALTSGLTTDLVPWVELSATLTFAGGGSNVTGAAAAAFTFDAPVSGKRTVKGSTTAAFTFNGQAVGRRTVKGSTVAPFTFNAPAVGTRKVLGSAAAAFTFNAPASGGAEGTVEGSASAAFTFNAPAVGRRTVLGSAAAPFTFNSPAVGRRTVRGSATAAFVFNASASGGEVGNVARAVMAAAVVARRIAASRAVAEHIADSAVTARRSEATAVAATRTQTSGVS